jgi:hypothetical protein
VGHKSSDEIVGSVGAWAAGCAGVLGINARESMAVDVGGLIRALEGLARAFRCLLCLTAAMTWV